MLNIGDKAPEFEEQDQEGNLVKLSDFKGRKLILYFYPKDNTPTCVKEACSLRDGYASLTETGYAVLGVSGDGPKSHKRFIDKFGLPFPLLADQELRVVNAYGVWKEKTTFGRTYMGIARTTFVINEEGLIEDIIDKVDSGNHAAQLLKTNAAPVQ